MNEQQNQSGKDRNISGNSQQNIPRNPSNPKPNQSQKNFQSGEEKEEVEQEPGTEINPAEFDETEVDLDRDTGPAIKPEKNDQSQGFNTKLNQ